VASHDIKKDDEHAILTNIIHQEWSGVSGRGHKAMKKLQSQNLRDHITGAELSFRKWKWAPVGLA
jgi:hypothetical protein